MEEKSSPRIRSLRRELNKSGTEVAEKLGISAQYYYDLEKGTKRLSAENVSKLAEIFDVSADYLLGISDFRKPDLMVREAPQEYRTVEVVKPSAHNNVPDFATSRDKRDLKKFLEQTEIQFDGVPLTDEDKAKIEGFMISMFWNAKEKNKRKKRTEE